VFTGVLKIARLPAPSCEEKNVNQLGYSKHMLFGNGQDSCMCRMGLLGLGTVASNAWIE